MPIKTKHKIPSANKSLAKKQHGFSLIEVMVSAFLISMGLIALTNLQTRSVRIAMVAYTETQSALHLQEMIEILRANKVAAAKGDYNIALSLFSELSSGGTSIAEKDRYNWFNNMNNTLPNAKASINCAADSSCTLALQHSVSGDNKKQSLAVIL